ncbi:MAG: IS21 family transposase [Myxococcales bacterium]|nr:IS21 family transposase [Myxococcales bacterium]
MRKTREILRLRLGLGLAGRAVARSVRCSPSTVSDCVARAEVAGLGWPLPEELDDAQLEARLYGRSSAPRPRPEPDYRAMHKELRRRGVTLRLLWQEYRAEHPKDGLEYSAYCERYRRWKQQLDVVMRQSHEAGDKLFVDYAGMTMPIIDPKTGEVTEASIFVAALGASNFIFTEAVAGEDLRSWTEAHIHCFEFLGGVTQATVPDNLKSGVTKPCFYDPDINPTYSELAEHYGTVVLPTRIRRPRDKGRVENGVQQVERWVLAPLRNQRFFSLHELNVAMRERLDALNNRPLTGLGESRRQLFEQIDRPALQPLPIKRFEVAERKPNVTVNIDYHVEYDRHYYSVPVALTRKKVDVRATATTIEVFRLGKRVTSHLRSYERGKYTTKPEHRPKSHREYGEWTPSRMLNWAATIGPSAAAVVKHILTQARHPEQGYRKSLGVIRLGRRYGNDRLELACKRALTLRSPSYKTVDSILKTGMESTPIPGADPVPQTMPAEHNNVRGPEYYN